METTAAATNDGYDVELNALILFAQIRCHDMLLCDRFHWFVLRRFSLRSQFHQLIVFDVLFLFSGWSHQAKLNLTNCQLFHLMPYHFIVFTFCSICNASNARVCAVNVNHNLLQKTNLIIYITVDGRLSADRTVFEFILSLNQN